ncbi:MAG TPA: XDD3 family exosortase-dependent surface protein [Trichocoleus sp.]|jgi:hypothetical protein
MVNSQSVFGNWDYAIDSSDDSIYYSATGNTPYEIHGLAVKETSDKVYFAVNTNLPASGKIDRNATDGQVNWGDLILNFNNSSLNAANKNSNLVGIRFAADNEAGVSGTGLFNQVRVKSVVQDNVPLDDPTLNGYNKRVKSAGSIPSLGDLAANAPYFNQNQPLSNVIQKGNRLGDITMLSPQELGDLNFGTLGTQTFGFSVSRALLPSGTFTASLSPECNNDVVALTGALSGQPAIDIETTINGLDIATPAEAPVIPFGNSITYNFAVRNTGDIAFAKNDLVLTDDKLGTITALQPATDIGNDSILSPGEQWLYGSIGVAVSSPSLQQNTATVTVNNSPNVTDSDTTYYIPTAPQPVTSQPTPAQPTTPQETPAQPTTPQPTDTSVTPSQPDSQPTTSQPTTPQPTDICVTPTQPDTSVTPSQPDTSVAPSQPDSQPTPAQSTTPQPTDQPTNTCVIPTQPDTSVTPSQPDTSVAPSQPDTSVAPSQPDSQPTPAQPTTPQPTDICVTPSQQDTSTASQPDTSVTPSQPDTSVAPSQQDICVAQNTAIDSQNQSSNQPQPSQEGTPQVVPASTPVQNSAPAPVVSTTVDNSATNCAPVDAPVDNSATTVLAGSDSSNIVNIAAATAPTAAMDNSNQSVGNTGTIASSDLTSSDYSSTNSYSCSSGSFDDLLQGGMKGGDIQTGNGQNQLGGAIGSDCFVLCQKGLSLIQDLQSDRSVIIIVNNIRPEDLNITKQGSNTGIQCVDELLSSVKGMASNAICANQFISF